MVYVAANMRVLDRGSISAWKGEEAFVATLSGQRSLPLQGFRLIPNSPSLESRVSLCGVERLMMLLTKNAQNILSLP